MLRPPALLLLDNCTVVDPASGSPPTLTSLLIEEGRIAAIGEAPPAQAERLDLHGAYVLPGFIDAHVHLTAGTANLGELRRWAPTYAAVHAAHRMAASLRRGFTRLRDVGGADWGLGRAVEEGLLVAPALHFGGRALSQTGGHGDMRAAGDEQRDASSGAISRVVDGVEALRAAARDELRLGASHIKLMLSGGVASPTDPVHRSQYTDEEIPAVVDEATAADAYVAGHCYPADGIARAARLGVRSIEHGNYADAQALDAIAEADAYLVPTLSTYYFLAREGPQAGLPAASAAKVGDLFDAGLDALRRAQSRGVSIAFGTDLIGTMHRHQTDEFTLRARVQEPLDVLRSATVAGAELLGVADRVGAIAEGYVADLVVVRSNPLEDLAVLTRPEDEMVCVLRGGRVVHRGVHRGAGSPDPAIA